MFLECHHQFWKYIWRDRGNCADGHIAGNFALELVHATPRITDRRQDLSRVLEQTASGFGNNDRTRQTIEQRLTDLRFQLSNLLAAPRLRDAHLRSGRRQISFVWSR